MSQEQFRSVISAVLAAGVAVSALLIAAGFALALTLGWNGQVLGSPAGAVSYADFGGLPARLAAIQPLAVVQLGLLTLIFTPVVRVAASALAFASEGDRLYAAITTTVLAILLVSILFLH